MDLDSYVFIVESSIFNDYINLLTNPVNEVKFIRPLDHCELVQICTNFTLKIGKNLYKFVEIFSVKVQNL